MKSLNSWSLRLRLLVLGSLITLICVVAGGFITRALLERERDFNKRARPHDQNYLVMRELIAKTGLPPHEVFRIVEKQRGRRAPYQVLLIDAQDRIIDSNPEEFPQGSTPESKLKELKKLEIAPGIFVAYNDRGWDGSPRDEPRKLGPSRLGFNRGGHGGPPPPGAHLVGLVAVSVSILVGLGLSIIFLTFYVRGKTSQAEIVIAKLRSGDLKARFKINQVDETTLLMQKFNEMADQIEELVSNLRATEKARMILLQELAHDLRTPVASLKNLQELLLDKGHLMDEDKRRHAQGLAVKEVYYFERLVEDLLFLSGVNDPRYSGNFKSVQLAELIQEENEVFESDQLHFELIAEGDSMISGDEHLLRRLIKNALSNASRFARSKIQITIKNTEESLTVHILDDGPGLDPSQIESFGHKKYSRRLQDTNDNISIGLGSVIMKKIMSLHDGDMKVQNHAPNGLELILIFPHR